MCSAFTKSSRIFVAGHCGMVGAAVVRRLQAEGCRHLLLRTRAELDLLEPAAVEAFFQAERPEIVILAAAKVGGIHANHTYPADFLRENLGMQYNVIDGARRHGVGRLLFLGSSCIYPRLAAQPIEEDSLLTGPLEITNEAYAIAKITGLKMCQYYRQQYGLLFHSAMPTNLYGPGDNYHPTHSHVLPALIRRFHEAKENGTAQVVIWGTGTPRREFLHVDDLADALLYLLRLDNPPDWVNVGCGEDIAIIDLAHLVAEIVGYKGEITTDPTKQDGTPRKLMDSSIMRSLGWSPNFGIKAGLSHAYTAFLQETLQGSARK